MSSRRRNREPTRQDRPQTRSYTQKAEECATRKPRLSDDVPSLSKYTLESTLTTQNVTGQEVLSPPNQYSETTTSQTTPHRVGSTPSSASLSTGMAFSYPRFSADIDAKGHARSFLNVWNANHMSQRLPEVEAHASKITEFGLTLDGRATH